MGYGKHVGSNSSKYFCRYKDLCQRCLGWYPPRSQRAYPIFAWYATKSRYFSRSQHCARYSRKRITNLHRCRKMLQTSIFGPRSGIAHYQRPYCTPAGWNRRLLMERSCKYWHCRILGCSRRRDSYDLYDTRRFGRITPIRNHRCCSATSQRFGQSCQKSNWCILSYLDSLRDSSKYDSRYLC